MEELSREELSRSLASHGQSHVLQFWDELDGGARSRLADQVRSLDLEQLAVVHASAAGDTDWGQVASRAQSPTAFRLQGASGRFRREDARAAADELIAAGRVGVILVAGGQGTRLGFPHPKGMYRIGPVSNRSLFQMHVDQLLAVAKRYRTQVPLYLMTSPATHAETVAYFEQNGRLGLSEDNLRVFCQGTMPALDDSGRLLLEAKDSIALSPDGHGGMLAALVSSGCLEDMRRRGVEQLFYFQVDNPLVNLCDRELLGFHVLSESEMSTLVVAKTDPLEKVGNVVNVDGTMRVIEYSDLPAAAAQRRDASGGLVFWAGSTAVHGMSVEFLRRAAATPDALPFHVARKKVPYLDAQGKQVNPTEPNATKFERFIFDLMPLARNPIVVEGDAREIFAPLKNASGASTDTPESTRAALVAKHTRWLQAAGAEVDAGVSVEIAPGLALDAGELRERLRLPLRVDADRFLDGDRTR